MGTVWATRPKNFPNWPFIGQIFLVSTLDNRANRSSKQKSWTIWLVDNHSVLDNRGERWDDEIRVQGAGRDPEASAMMGVKMEIE